MSDKYLWVEAHSPKTVSDCILPASIKKTFAEYVNEKTFPNLILAGPAILAMAFGPSKLVRKIRWTSTLHGKGP